MSNFCPPSILFPLFKIYQYPLLQDVQKEWWKAQSDIKKKYKRENKKMIEKEIKKARDKAEKVKNQQVKKHLKKANHLLKESINEEKESKIALEKSLRRYQNIDILTNIKSKVEEKDKNVKESEKAVLKIDVTLTDEEEEVLKLPLKYSIHQKLSEVDLSEAIEVAQARDDENSNNKENPDETTELTDEEKKKFEIEEARTRLIFTQETRTLNIVRHTLRPIFIFQ